MTSGLCRNEEPPPPQGGGDRGFRHEGGLEDVRRRATVSEGGEQMGRTRETVVPRKSKSKSNSKETVMQVVPKQTGSLLLQLSSAA